MDRIMIVIRAIMTFGDMFPGYKTHISTAIIAITAVLGWLTEVVLPIANGDIIFSFVPFVQASWVYFVTFFGAFGASAVKAAIDRK